MTQRQENLPIGDEEPPERAATESDHTTNIKYHVMLLGGFISMLTGHDHPSFFDRSTAPDAVPQVHPRHATVSPKWTVHSLRSLWALPPAGAALLLLLPLVAGGPNAAAATP